MLVTFEGIEAAGKSTLIAALAHDLSTRGIDVLVTKEPGGTPLGEALRAVFLDPSFRIDPIAEAMLINASRAQLVADVVAPALKRGAIVLCDRFFDATVAYQGFGRGLDVEALLEICLVATHRIAPDLTFLVDVPVEVSAQRVRARGGADRLEREGAEFHGRVRDGYLALAQRFARIAVLDGTQQPVVLVAAALAEIDRRTNLAPR
ncbi:MAG: dTMP kinase [Candidatus Elarobacter sp.]